MKLSARIISGVAALALTVSMAQPAHANLDAFLETMEQAKDDWLILTSEYGRDGHHSQLSIQPGFLEDGVTRGDWIMCTTINDEGCTGTEARKNMMAWSLLPDCNVADSKVCIEQIRVGTTTGTTAPAKYVSSLTGRHDFAGDAPLGLLPGGGLPLYEMDPAAQASSTTNLAVMVRVETEVIPYKLISGDAKTLGCSFRIENQCAVIQDFNEDAVVDLTFNIPNDLGGWFSGRMESPNISVKKLNTKINTIQIAAQPVEVAALGLVKNFDDFTAKEKFWQQGHGKWSVGNELWATGANSWQPDVFPFIENYRSQVNDTAIGTNRVWNFMSINSGGGSGCLADKSKVLGIVTTNALGYAGESPRFSGGSLTYKVAGLHYLPGGKELVLGSYDLVMRSDVARCLYGFPSAPLSATVTVLNDKGTKTAATTVVSEKNGWLKLAAKGFTFSKKTIKVKITKKVVKKK
jgi:hypothetical protein